MKAHVMLALLSACLSAPGVFAGYGKKSGVATPSAKSFDTDVLKSDGVVIVAFYAPWCGHCKALEPEWKSAAKLLKGVVTIAAIDATDPETKSLASRYGVKGFPTIKVFGADKNAPTDYQGGRTAPAIVQAAMQEVGKLVQSRGGMPGGSGGSGSGGSSNVVELNDASFDAKVLNSKELWVVKFVAPWCGHCKKLEPEYDEAATTLNGEPVKLGSVDATAEKGLGSRFGVEGFPTIKVFAPNSVKDSDAMDYNGARDADGIVSEVQRLLEEHAGPVEIAQLTSSAVLEENCPPKKICVIAVLPHILDGGKAARNEYLAMLTTVATKQRRGPFRFLWSEGGAQRDVEAALGMNFGYPALAAVSRAKNVRGLHRGAFDGKKVSIFLTGITSGRVKTSKMAKGELIVADVAEWDGEDGAAFEEEEFSLDDIMGDDDEEEEL